MFLQSNPIAKSIIAAFMVFSPASLPTALAAECTASTQELINRLDSSHPDVRRLAQHCALSHGDRAMRAVGLKRALAEADVIAISVDNFAGDVEAAKFLPRLSTFSVHKLKWSAAGSSFTGRIDGEAGAVIGNLTGDRLSLSYSDATYRRQSGGWVGTNCSVIMELTPARDGLEGPLRCSDIPHRFRARFPL